MSPRGGVRVKPEDVGDVEFVDELPESGWTAKRNEWASKIRAQPGRWAKWPTTSPAVQIQKLLGDDFECVGRMVDGKQRAFVRFVGNHDDDLADPDDGVPGLLDPDPPSDGRPRVNCAGCGDWLTIKPGSDRRRTLEDHTTEHPSCARILRRRS